MRRVVAFLDDSPIAPDVSVTADTLAHRLGVAVDKIRVVDADSAAGRRRSGDIRSITGTPEEQLVAELDSPGTLIGVIGARSIRSKPHAVGHVAEALLLHATRPVVVIPPGARPLEGDTLRFLLPLDGATATTAAVMPIASQLGATLDDVITLHVFDSATVPMFVTSPHDREVIANEFLATHSAACSNTAHLRLGHPASEILDVARAEQVDAIILTWQRRFEADRAHVVRRLLRESPIPLVLQPMTAQHPPSRA